MVVFVGTNCDWDLQMGCIQIMCFPAQKLNDAFIVGVLSFSLAKENDLRLEFVLWKSSVT